MEPGGGPSSAKSSSTNDTTVPNPEVIRPGNNEYDNTYEREPEQNSETDNATIKEASPNHIEKNESIVFNYSNITLTKPMENLLNRGFNFSILANKIDTTKLCRRQKI